MKTEEWMSKLNDQKRAISATSIVDGLRCERLYYFKYRIAIRPKVRQYSKGATTGTLVHKLMKAGRDGVEKIQQDIIKQHSSLVERIKAGEDLTGDLARAADDLNHLYQKARAIVTIFWERFPPKNYMTTICREERKEGFAHSYFTQGAVPCVWIADWIVRDDRADTIWIRDVKTTGEDFESIMVGFLYSIQCRFYRIMASQEEWGDKVKGFILDMVRVPTIKLCGKDEKQAAKLGCTPFEAYVQRVKEWYENEAEETMKSEAIIFNEDIHSPEMMRSLGRVIDLWERPAEFSLFSRDLTRSRCYWNRKTCPYYALCSSSPAAWPSLIETFYEVREAPKTKTVEECNVRDDGEKEDVCKPCAEKERKALK